MADDDPIAGLWFELAGIVFRVRGEIGGGYVAIEVDPPGPGKMVTILRANRLPALLTKKPGDPPE